MKVAVLVAAAYLIGLVTGLIATAYGRSGRYTASTVAGRPSSVSWGVAGRHAPERDPWPERATVGDTAPPIDRG